jgi:nucleotide-binding universal stress UspA family protein
MTTSLTVTHPHRKIAIAVDLSDESAFAVKWAVENYLRPSDHVILLHVRPTYVLYGADWGCSAIPQNPDSGCATESESQQRKLEDEFENFTTTKANSMAQPLVQAQIPFKIHIVKDHDMKERLCLEVERLGLSAVIMGSRGFGASSKRSTKARLGSVSDYCVHHCICPVVVVRYPDDNHSNNNNHSAADKLTSILDEVELHPVPEAEEEEHDHDHDHDYHDASDLPKGNTISILYVCHMIRILLFYSRILLSIAR